MLLYLHTNITGPLVSDVTSQSFCDAVIKV